MSTFLRTSGISYNIEEIVLNARNKLVLVTPYIKFSQILYERLQERANDGVEIVIVYGKSELTREQEKSIKSIKGISLYFLSNLHAKCYLNEDTAIITSMNLYEFSEKNNREMGILISRIEDEATYNDTLLEINSILNASKLEFGSSTEFLVAMKENTLNQNRTIKIVRGANFSDTLKKSVQESFDEVKVNMNCIRDYGNGKLYGLEDFKIENFYVDGVNLEVSPFFNGGVRFTLHMNYKSPTKTNLFKYLEGNSFLIQKQSKFTDLSWGNQMREIKINLNSSISSVAGEYSDADVEAIINALDSIRLYIIPIVKTYFNEIGADPSVEMYKPVMRKF